ncbi:Calponin-3, partial [Quaeritorhiza haematococci]
LMSRILNENIKFNNSKMPFKQMENINTFLQGADKLGVPKSDLFQTIDLYESKNMNQVIDSIFAISRHAVKHGFNGPLLGPKLAEKREVNFTEEQLQQGKNIIGLQMGFAGGANQSGISYGGRRQIMDPTVGTGDTSVLTQQMGYGAGANASGIVYGGRRDIGGSDPGRLNQIQ